MGTSLNENEIISYLLGAVPEADAERFDELSVVDDAFAAALSAAENDLVDQYVRGELSGETLTRFQDHYLSSPLRRRKVQFAQSLAGYGHVSSASRKVSALQSKAEVADAADRDGVPRDYRPNRTRSRGLFPWNVSPAAANGLAGAVTVAMILLIAAGIYLLRESHRLHLQMDREQTERAALEQTEHSLESELAKQQSAASNVSKLVATMREQIERLKQESGAHPPSPSVSSPVSSLAVVVFTLAAPLRGAGPPPSISVPAGTHTVLLNLRLEPSDIGIYKAALNDPATGRIIWEAGRLNPQTKDGSKVVAVPIRARLLKSQHYTIDLSGLGSDGNWEIVGTYTFRVQTSPPKG